MEIKKQKYLLQYHSIFVCKYRKKLLVSEQILDDIKQFSCGICQKHNVIIKYMETDKDHIHYMIETEPGMSISRIVNPMKSYTTYHIWERYPNDEQKVQIAKTFGCCRFVYNQTLLYRKEAYEKEKKSVSKTECNMELKKEYEWLREVDKFALTNGEIGLDLGIKDLCITSDGNKYENPKTIKKYEKKLIKLQRRLADKEKRSSNYCKTKKQIALCHEKITNTRKDYLHKISHEIINENQVIVSENLQIKNMVKKHHLAKALSDASWYELTRQLEYKGAWNGRKYIKVDTFFASSQICSNCGYQNTDTKDLSVRKWKCPACGTGHDRDVNAAKNILAEGLRQIA
ncbi:IS200/IS605 family transposase [Lachnospiraceae bacterium 54-53]